MSKEESPEDIVTAHEWQCQKCRYLLRLEFGPLFVEGCECSRCGDPVEYHKVKEVRRSQLGMTRPYPSLVIKLASGGLFS